MASFYAQFPVSRVGDDVLAYLNELSVSVGLDRVPFYVVQRRWAKSVGKAFPGLSLREILQADGRFFFSINEKTKGVLIGLTNDADRFHFVKKATPEEIEAARAAAVEGKTSGLPPEERKK